MYKFSETMETNSAPASAGVLAKLQEDILTGQMRPGEKIIEQRLCERYGASRTPVREALRQLELDGLVEYILNRGYFVIGIIGMGQEPTNHALRDICKVKDDFDQWGRPLLLLFESEEEARKFKASDYGQMPKNTLFGIDADGSIKRQIVNNMKLDDRQLPIFLIADTFNRVVFCSQGYTIGLGEQMQRTIIKIKN